jgi:hypothetical protein
VRSRSASTENEGFQPAAGRALLLGFPEKGGPFFEAIPFRVSDYEKRTPIMHEMRKDGITL